MVNPMRIKHCNIFKHGNMEIMLAIYQYFDKNDNLMECDMSMAKVGRNKIILMQIGDDELRFTEQQRMALWNEAESLLKEEKKNKIRSYSDDGILDKIIDIILSRLTISYDENRKLNYLTVFNRETIKDEMKNIVR